ncbi:DUF1289 domain-containing protein [Thalassotalea sp. PLHSN55]|uniref:DUF1289 domain-containing protein n=1 Tax=Thalassotalea sp. PLHSN55 TaxID=3435888 RepID=UPI003F8319B5
MQNSIKLTTSGVQENTQVESPCIRKCCLNEQDICLGCFRHIDEITGWSKTSTQEKHAILASCKRRKAKTS